MQAAVGVEAYSPAGVSKPVVLSTLNVTIFAVSWFATWIKLPDGSKLKDILVANDSSPQQLFRNSHDGTYEEIALGAGLAYDDDGRTFAGMGVDAADYDRD